MEVNGSGMATCAESKYNTIHMYLNDTHYNNTCTRTLHPGPDTTDLRLDLRPDEDELPE